MRVVILICMAAVAVAAPVRFETPAPAPEGPSDPLQSEYSSTVEVVPILKDERIQEDDGRYSVDVETGNGIKLSESGSPDGPDGAVIKAGQYEYTAPDGTLVQLKFVANENGFQPQSDLLPVAPEFPHPIPQFVLDQIEFAAQEAAAAAAAEGAEGAESGIVETAVTPSQFYISP
nr:cuticle protein AMP1A-like [Penaeus vannamei]